MKKPQETTKGW